MPKKTTNASLPKKSCDFFFCPEKKISAFFLPPQNSQIRTTCKLGGHDLKKDFVVFVVVVVVRREERRIDLDVGYTNNITPSDTTLFTKFTHTKNISIKI